MKQTIITAMLALSAMTGLGHTTRNTNDQAGQSLTSKSGVSIHVDVAQKGIEISPTLYGIFYEDINFASDGGLYAELIRNRSFEYDAEKPAHWKAEGANIGLVAEGLLNEKQGHALKVEVTEPGGGISNEGYWGINAVAGTRYKLSFWTAPLQLPRGGETAFKVSLKSKDGKLLGETRINLLPTSKKKKSSPSTGKLEGVQSSFLISTTIPLLLQ